MAAKLGAKLNNPGGSLLVGKFTAALSRKVKDLDVSPKLKASSMVKKKEKKKNSFV